MSTYLLRLAQRGAGLDPVRVQPPFRPTFLPDTGHVGVATEEVMPEATAPPEPQSSDASSVSRPVPMEGAQAPWPPSSAVPDLPAAAPGPSPDVGPAQPPEPVRTTSAGKATQEASPRHAAEPVRPLLPGEPPTVPPIPARAHPAEDPTGDVPRASSPPAIEPRSATTLPTPPKPAKTPASNAPLPASKPPEPGLGEAIPVQPVILRPRTLPVSVATPAPEAPPALPEAPASVAARSAPTAAPVPVEVRIGTVEVRAEKPTPPPTPLPAPKPQGFGAYVRLRNYERWS